MIVIDGYNLSFARKDRALARSSRNELQAARESLLDLLADYYAVRREPILVVFDGDKSDDPGPRRNRRAGIEVLFSPHRVNADTVIKGYVMRARHPGDLRVVTSDREVAAAARAAGAAPVESPAFLEHVRATIAPPPVDRAPEEPGGKSAGLGTDEADRWLREFGVDGDVPLTDDDADGDAPPPRKSC